MSTRYVAVNWNRQKRIYDTVIALAVPGLVALFVLTTLLTHPAMTPETGLIRGFGGGGGGGRGGGAPPVAGTFTARLTVNGKSYTRTFTVKPDPRSR